jgi:hypothetical protein
MHLYQRARHEGATTSGYIVPTSSRRESKRARQASKTSRKQDGQMNKDRMEYKHAHHIEAHSVTWTYTFKGCNTEVRKPKESNSTHETRAIS